MTPITSLEELAIATCKRRLFNLSVSLIASTDPEMTHHKADEAVMDLLIALGHQQVVERWKAVPRGFL